MFDFLISWLLGLVNALWSALIFIANLLYALILFVYQGLVFVALHVWAALQSLARLFTRLWTDIIRRGVLKLFELYERVRAWLERVLAPVIRIIQRIRKILDDIFFTYIKPILDVIQRVRRVLRALRLLGFKWAEKLDRRLFEIETRITEGFLFLRGWVVFVQDLLERVIDPDLLFSVPVFGGSLGKWLGSLGALFGALGLSRFVGLSRHFSSIAMREDLAAARRGEDNWLRRTGGVTRATRDALREAAR